MRNPSADLIFWLINDCHSFGRAVPPTVCWPCKTHTYTHTRRKSVYCLISVRLEFSSGDAGSICIGGITHWWHWLYALPCNHSKHPRDGKGEIESVSLLSLPLHGACLCARDTRESLRFGSSSHLKPPRLINDIRPSVRSFAYTLLLFLFCMLLSRLSARDVPRFMRCPSAASASTHSDQDFTDTYFYAGKC